MSHKYCRKSKGSYTILYISAHYFAVRYGVEYGLDFDWIVYANTDRMRGRKRV